MHKAKSTWVETVPVTEAFRGQTIWHGKVEVFDLNDYPKAKKCYAWSHLDGKRDEREKVVAVLGIPPVDSAQSAVKIAIASEVRSKKLDKKSGV